MENPGTDLQSILNNMRADLEKKLVAINLVEELVGVKSAAASVKKETIPQRKTRTVHHRRRSAEPVPTRTSEKNNVMVSDNRVLKKINEWSDEFTIGQILKEFSGLTRADARGIISRLLKDHNIEQVEEGRGRKPAVYKPLDAAGSTKENQTEARV